VLRYVKGTYVFGFFFLNDADFRLNGCTNSDWAGSVDERKTTSGYAFNLRSEVASWTSKIQSFGSISLTEAEYKAMIGSTCEVVWLQILSDMMVQQVQRTPSRRDNYSAVKTMKDLVFPASTKHIEVHHHYIRE
jgi:hypothetical protein